MKCRIRENIQRKVNDLGLESLYLDELIHLDGNQIDDYIIHCKSEIRSDILKKTRRKIKNREYAQRSRDSAKVKKQKLTKKLEKITCEVSNLREENRRLKIILGIAYVNYMSESESE